MYAGEYSFFRDGMRSIARLKLRTRFSFALNPENVVEVDVVKQVENDDEDEDDDDNLEL